jgi:hypothetical protein
MCHRPTGATSTHRGHLGHLGLPRPPRPAGATSACRGHLGLPGLPAAMAGAALLAAIVAALLFRRGGRGTRAQER